MKITLVILFNCILFTLHSQRFYITPYVGVKAELASNNIGSSIENPYFNVSRPYIHAGISPVLLGLNLEYFNKKNLFSVGIVSGDQANSLVEVDFFTKTDSPYTNYRFKSSTGNYAGYNVLKIQFAFKREFFSTYSKRKPQNKHMTFRWHIGLNLQILKIKNVPTLHIPIGGGPYETLQGDTIYTISYAGHYNRSFSVSFNVGIDCDFFIRNNRNFNVQLYYEQGTYLIAQSARLFYKLGEEQPIADYRSTSRGSSIHLKLGFPINIPIKKRDKL